MKPPKRDVYDAMLRDACAGREYINGVKIGPAPKYFIVGDRPVYRDFLTKRPFSGPLRDIMAMTMDVMAKKYGAKPEDFYVTYLVKAKFADDEVTEERIKNDWLPVIQLEYQLSGCSEVVAVGQLARGYAGYIVQRGLLQPSKGISFMGKVKTAWQILVS